MCKDNNMITIIIDNYKDGKIIYKMPDRALIDLYQATMIAGENAGKVFNIEINAACSEGIEIIKEGIS